MSRTLSLYALAHGRSGDKGDAVNIGIIARRPEWLPMLRDLLTEERVLAFLGDIDRPADVVYAWLADFEKLPIKPEVRQMILKDNAARLLGLA